MKWREFRAFLNTKFEDDQYISLSVDYNTGNVVIQKDNVDSEESHAFILHDKTYIPECSHLYPFRMNDDFYKKDPIRILYYENEISTYFRGFKKE